MSNNIETLMAELTDKVIATIECDLEGKWSKPWTTMLDKRYTTNVWATYRQWQSIGGQVQKASPRLTASA